MTDATGMPGPTDTTPLHQVPTRTRGAVWTSIAVGIVFALVGTLFLVKVVGGSSVPKDTTTLTATSPVVATDLTTIPASVFNAVGIRSPDVPIVAPVVTTDATPLYFSAPDGARLPGVLYVGAEYCSFCAAERWALIAALSRFGTFNALYDMESSAGDFAPSTPTFTFYSTAFKSSRVVFRPYEVASDVPDASGYKRLMAVPHHERVVLRALDPTGRFPFVDVGNRAVVLQGAFSPQTLAGLTREQIASQLTNSTNPVTESIVASANYLAAAICASDADRPASVCQSPGVTDAAAAMRLVAKPS